MSDFFITLVSNSSMKIFPANKTACFTVLLPEKISLKGDWSVAVAEIHYNYNFFNVNDENNKIKLIHNVADENTNEIDKITAEDIVTLEVTCGYYNSVIDLIAAINHQLSPYLENNESLLSIDKKSNRTIINTNYVKKSVHHIYLEGRLGMQLGFEPHMDILQAQMSPHVGNLRFGVPDQMFIYTDIIDPTFIGHEKAYVIKVVNTEGKKFTFGDTCYKEYTHMHYMRLQKREFETISVDIRDYTGQFMPFQHGVLMIKLHFKSQNAQQVN